MPECLDASGERNTPQPACGSLDELVSSYFECFFLLGQKNVPCQLRGDAFSCVHFVSPITFYSVPITCRFCILHEYVQAVLNVCHASTPAWPSNMAHRRIRKKKSNLGRPQNPPVGLQQDECGEPNQTKNKRCGSATC